jgi:preprotein translocase subunit SecY
LRGIDFIFNNDFQEAERKIPINYASRFTSRSGGLEKSAYLPFKVLSSFTNLFYVTVLPYFIVFDVP